MIVGVTGDTHNNLKNIKKICSIFNENRVDLVFHTGDISLPKSLKAFQELNCPMKAVFGNNDVPEKIELVEVAKSLDCKIYEEPLKTFISKKRITVLHHPELINEELCKNSDLILHGHTHRYRKEIIRNCLIFNPGECAGIMEGKNKVGIVNLKNLEAITLSF